MQSIFRTIVFSIVFLAITGCSGTGNLPEFTTAGVTVPSGACSVDPRSFAEAESLGDVGQGACVIHNAYRVTAMSGIRFSQAGTINCPTAVAFDKWLTETVQPAAQELHGARVTQVEIAATYACRPRNGRSGGQVE